MRNATEMGFAPSEAEGARAILEVSGLEHYGATVMDLARFKHLSLTAAASAFARGGKWLARLGFAEVALTTDAQMRDYVAGRVKGQAEAYSKTVFGELERAIHSKHHAHGEAVIGVPAFEVVEVRKVSYLRGTGCCEESPVRVIEAYFLPDGTLLHERDTADV